MKYNCKQLICVHEYVRITCQLSKQHTMDGILRYAFGFLRSAYTNGNGIFFGPTSVDTYADITLVINSGSSSQTNMIM